MSSAYVHGYDPREAERLADQAGTLVELLHHDTAYPPGSTVLEAGCGVGAQTVTLAAHSPGARITSIDVSAESLAEAERKVGEGVEFLQADIFDLPFDDDSFDHVFVCFVLEHLSQPVEALTILKRVLRPGGTITVIEGDHGSAYFHPQSAEADAAIRCLIDLQADAGGDSLIGRRVYPADGRGGLRRRARIAAGGLRGLQPAGDGRGLHPQDFHGNGGGRSGATAIAAGMIEPDAFDAGIRDLYRTARGGRHVLVHLLQGRGREALTLLTNAALAAV